LKAADVSPIGAFKTSTGQALNEVIDHEKKSFLPSPSAVHRCWAKLDDYSFQFIRYEHHDNLYGEVFYINF